VCIQKEDQNSTGGNIFEDIKDFSIKLLTTMFLSIIIGVDIDLLVILFLLIRVKLCFCAAG
jgi:hypothetical protein